MAMSSSQVTRPRRLVLSALAVLLVAALVTLVIGGYQFVSTADALHLVVSNDDTSATLLDRTTPNAANDVAKVQHLYAHILALPHVKPGSYSCPIGPSFTYHLTFTHRGITTLATSIDTNGCAFISVFGVPRYTDDEFWSLLGQAVNATLPLPGPISLRGVR